MRLGLRSKFVIVILGIAISVSSLIHFYWMPNYISVETEHQIKDEQYHVSLLSSALAPDLLANDLAKLHHALDDIKQAQKNWHAIRVLDRDEHEIYPIYKTSIPAGIITREFSSPITHDGELLGHLKLLIDINSPMQLEISYLQKLEWILLSITILTAMFAYFLLDRWILKPLRSLGQFSSSIASGDYSRKLEYQSHDEVGQLVSSFNLMREKVSQREESLMNVNAINKLTRTIQKKFITNQDKVHVFSELQERIVELTKSEFGFIGEVLRNINGEAYLKIYALSNIAWDHESRLLYDQRHESSMEFHNPDSLIGHVFTKGELLISNDPDNDERSAGIPAGHPALHSFMGVPIYHGRKMVGMMGLANRKGGYTQKIYEEGFMLTSALGGLISAHRLQEAMTVSEARFRSVVDSSVEGIVSIDAEGHIQIFNRAAERIFGYSSEQALGQNVKILMPEMDKNNHDGHISRYNHTGQSKAIGIERELKGLHKNGHTFPIELSVSRVETPSGVEFTGIVRDISERKRNEQDIKEINDSLAKANIELEQLARKDGLTGIYNRRHFDETLAAELLRAARKKEPLSLIMSDIDYFKRFNDCYGHQVGDDCLIQVARAIDECFNRAGDVVARYGGEEFAVIIPGLDEISASNLAEKMRHTVESLGLQHEKSECSEVVTMSIGIDTVIPNSKTSVEEIIRHADKALYLAKSKGRNNVQARQKEDKNSGYR